MLVFNLFKRLSSSVRRSVGRAPKRCTSLFEDVGKAIVLPSLGLRGNKTYFPIEGANAFFRYQLVSNDKVYNDKDPGCVSKSIESVKGGMDCQSFPILRHATSGRNRVQTATCSVVNTRRLAPGRSLGVMLCRN